VSIPVTLRHLTGESKLIESRGATLIEVLDVLFQDYPDLRPRVLRSETRAQRFLNIYVDGTDVRHLDGLGSRVPEGGRVDITVALAGG
jgi:molybdopterin synthase sulfur carrier subunit